jgi:hypothetical protein
MLAKLGVTGQVSQPIEFETEDKLRVAAFALAFLLLTLRLDGWKAGNFETLIQLALVPYSLLFIFCVVVFLWPKWFKRWLGNHRPGLLAWIDGWNMSRLVVGIGFGFEVITFGLLILQARIFERYDYRLNLWLAGALFLLLAAGFGWFWVANRKLEHFFFFALAAYALVYLLSIISFPLNLGRSDMLPIMTLSNQNILDGHFPYSRQFSTIPETGNYLDYFPANVLFYFPGTLLKTDLRFTNLACVLLIAFILYKTVDARAKGPVLALFSLFLLCPFFQYRHDLYETPEWLLLTCFVVVLSRRKLLWGGFILGIGLTLTPFNFVLVPFYLLYLVKTFNLGKAVLALVTMGIGVLLVVGPFLLWSFSDFTSSLVNGLDRKAVVLSTPSVNLAYLVYQLVPIRYAKIIQAVVLAVVLFMAWPRMKCLADCLAWMTIGLLLFIALNTYVNGYFYFFIGFLLISQRFAVNPKEEIKKQEL